ncbi:MAG TPA: DUF3826 domain-containing protein [Lacunisphaera sp.]|nr:DUF3826 domain-containing protein [Lacunisphaera sp.]
MTSNIRSHLTTLLASFALAGATLARADASADEATQKRANDKAGRLVAVAKVEDAAKADRAKGILADWYLTMWAWHKDNDPKLKELWTQWNQARAVVPKDEFPGEVIAHQIDDVYASLKPTYHAMVEKLSVELTPDQVDAIKEQWSRSPGKMRTYNAYLEIVPDLSEKDKKVLLDRMDMAREDAMLTDADREIVNIFKRHKVKVEAYVGTLEWAKLHSAFANRGKEKPASTAK